MQRVYEEKQDCCGCGACGDVCPVGAIRMVTDREGFRYPEVDPQKCMDCGRCEKVCPVKHSGRMDTVGEKAAGTDGTGVEATGADTTGTGTRSRETGSQDAGRETLAAQEVMCYGGRAKEDAVRSQSSSGGIFPVLAEYVLSQGGFVYGAAYTDQMEVAHREISSPAELDVLKRTKYVQSNGEGMYRSIEGRLKEGHPVLFVGTPCQAHALQLFLGREYPGLVVVALICYGVPSPGVWQSYVAYLERKHKGKMTSFFFRDKRRGDSGHTCAFVIDGREYAGSLYQDPYCQMYFANAILRPSCHACRFCTTERDSDFTIGDFWGIEKVKPGLDVGMGHSVILLHSDKARQVWEEVKGNLSWFACGKEDVLQPRLLAPTPAWKGRERFWSWYGRLPFGVFQRLFVLFRRAGALWGRGRKVRK